jgi:hypothetical protein
MENLFSRQEINFHSHQLSRRVILKSHLTCNEPGTFTYLLEEEPIAQDTK